MPLKNANHIVDNVDCLDLRTCRGKLNLTDLFEHNELVEYPAGLVFPDFPQAGLVRFFIPPFMVIDDDLFRAGLLTKPYVVPAELEFETLSKQVLLIY